MNLPTTSSRSWIRIAYGANVLNYRHSVFEEMKPACVVMILQNSTQNTLIHVCEKTDLLRMNSLFRCVLVLLLVLFTQSRLSAQTLLNTHCGSAPASFHLTTDSLKSLYPLPDSLLEIFRLRWDESRFLELRKYPNTCTEG